MSIISPFVRWAVGLRKVSNEYTEYWNASKGFSFNRESAKSIMEGGYMSNGAVYSLVTKTALLAGALPTRVMKGDKEAMPEDPARLLWENPNDEQDTSAYMSELFTYLVLLGDCYALIDQGESIGISEHRLLALPAQAVTCERVNRESIMAPIKGYTFTDYGKQWHYDPEEIIHCKLLDPTVTGKYNNDGLSPLQAGSLEIRALNNANVAEATIFENGGKTTLLSSKENSMALSKQDKETLDQANKSRFGGAHKQGLLQTVRGVIQATTIGSTPKELGIPEERVQLVRQICNLWGVSSGIFNDPQAKTYNNEREAQKALYLSVVIPRAEQIIARHSRTLKRLFGEEYHVEIDIAGIDALQETPQEKLEAWRKLYKDGAVSKERLLEEFDIEDNGTTFVRQTGLRNNTTDDGQ